MKKTYNEEIDELGNAIIWYEENGLRVSFTKNLDNSDYQDYLKYLDESKQL